VTSGLCLRGPVTLGLAGHGLSIEHYSELGIPLAPLSGQGPRCKPFTVYSHNLSGFHEPIDIHGRLDWIDLACHDDRETTRCWRET
jgi:hypothetical protein